MPNGVPGTAEPGGAVASTRNGAAGTSTTWSSASLLGSNSSLPSYEAVIRCGPGRERVSEQAPAFTVAWQLAPSSARTTTLPGTSRDGDDHRHAGLGEIAASGIEELHHGLAAQRHPPRGRAGRLGEEPHARRRPRLSGRTEGDHPDARNDRGHIVRAHRRAEGPAGGGEPVRTGRRPLRGHQPS